MWSPRFGLEVSPRGRLERRTDLTGVLLRGTSEAESPFILTPPAERPEELSPGQVWREGQDLAQVRVEEFCGDIWTVLQETTNFSFSMVTFHHYFLLLYPLSSQSSSSSLRSSL